MTSTDNRLRRSKMLARARRGNPCQGGEIPSGDAQSALLDIAAMYDRMAKRAAEKEAKGRLA